MTRRPRILIVDDEPSMRTSLADIVGEEGFEVALAAEGDEAAALCAQRPFDVVLTDLRMAGLAEEDHFRRIRRHHAAARTILMSAHDPDTLKQTALGEGAVCANPAGPGPAGLQEVGDREGSARGVILLPIEGKTVASRRSALEDWGYRVEAAPSVHEALEQRDRRLADVVLCTARPAALTGGEEFAVRRLTPAALAMLVAGVEEEFENLVEQSAPRPAYAFLAKPLDLDRLLAMLERIRERTVLEM